jgi:hypothetical protein
MNSDDLLSWQCRTIKRHLRDQPNVALCVLDKSSLQPRFKFGVRLSGFDGLVEGA